MPARKITSGLTHTALLSLAVVLLGTSACTGTDSGAPEQHSREGSGGALTSGEGDTATGGNNATASGGNDAGSGGVGTGGDGSPSGGAGTGGDGSGGDTAAQASSGCGATSPPTSGAYTITVNGKTREYTLDVPDDYDTNAPYPITFGLHWRGGNSGDVVANGYYGLKEGAQGSMLFVSPEGLTPNGTSGWANSGGEDVEFIALMLDRFESELCIDTTRVFATGFSYGGMFSNAIGCGLADRFTAVAPYSGSLWSGCEDGSTPIGYLGTHGYVDEIVEIPAGREARDEFIARNGCTTETTPYGEHGCVAYSGCQEPLVWCEYNDGHWWPGFASDEVWNFFSQF